MATSNKKSGLCATWIDTETFKQAQRLSTHGLLSNWLPSIVNPIPIQDKTKTAYLEFKHLDRDITICALGLSNGFINLGFCIRKPDETYRQHLARDIAKGRAKKIPFKQTCISPEFSMDYGILKSFTVYLKIDLIKHLTYIELTNIFVYKDEKLKI